MTKTGLIE